AGLGWQVAYHEHALDRLQLAHHLGGHRAIDFHERVRHGPARLVEHVVDVESRLGHGGGDLTQHVGHVRVRDPYPVRRLARHHDVGEVHRVDDVAVFQVVANLVGHHDGAVLLRFAGR